MPQQAIEVLGANNVELTAELFAETMGSKYGRMKLSGRDRKAEEQALGPYHSELKPA